jgi:hypothetical protein
MRQTPSPARRIPRLLSASHSGRQATAAGRASPASPY